MHKQQLFVDFFSPQEVTTPVGVCVYIVCVGTAASGTVLIHVARNGTVPVHMAQTGLPSLCRATVSDSAALVHVTAENTELLDCQSQWQRVTMNGWWLVAVSIVCDVVMWHDVQFHKVVEQVLMEIHSHEQKMFNSLSVSTSECPVLPLFVRSSHVTDIPTKIVISYWY